MRYFKGCIALNAEHDLPMLEQVLHSGFVTHQQLWKFMRQGGYERQRECFNWRAKRLVDHGFLTRQMLSGVTRSFVYSLTEQGADELIGLDQSCPGATAFFNRKHDHGGIRHAVELNEIHLVLAASGRLGRWTSDIELRSRNEFTACGYAKDYDALIDLKFDGVEVQVALEYEREAKSQSRYADIVSAIANEQHVDRFLYLVPDYDLLFFVHRFFAGMTRRVYFGIACEFKRQLLQMRVLDRKLAHTSLDEALRV